MTTFGAWSITYDDDGNVTEKSRSGETISYGWNDLGQLVSVTDASGTTAFTYDALGRRIAQDGPAGSTQFVWDGQNVAMDVSLTGNLERTYSYYPGGTSQLHSVYDGSDGYLYQRDLTGNVMGLIRSSDGAIAATYDYTPFGQTTADETYVQNRFRFASGEFVDAGSAGGLYYFRNRYYDPDLRRWISEDPLGLGGGGNWYAYVGNDPINLADPWGLKAQADDLCDVWSVSFVNGVPIFQCAVDGGGITATVPGGGEDEVPDSPGPGNPGPGNGGPDEPGPGGPGGRGPSPETSTPSPAPISFTACMADAGDVAAATGAAIIGGALAFGGRIAQSEGAKAFVKGMDYLDRFFAARVPSSLWIEDGIALINNGRTAYAVGGVMTRAGIVIGGFTAGGVIGAAAMCTFDRDYYR